MLNHTLIDKITNIRIGGNAPAIYLSNMKDELGGTLAVILRSHILPYEEEGPLWQGRFEEFLQWRQGRLAERAETGDPSSDVVVHTVTLLFKPIAVSHSGVISPSVGFTIIASAVAEPVPVQKT